MRTINVMCVDDNLDLLAAVRWLIDHTPGMSLVGALTSSRNLADEAAARHADVILLDLRIPGEKPLDELQSLVAAGSPVKIVIFSGDYITEGDLETIGAAGYVCKGWDPHVIVDIIQGVGAQSRT